MKPGINEGEPEDHFMRRLIEALTAEPELECPDPGMAALHVVEILESVYALVALKTSFMTGNSDILDLNARLGIACMHIGDHWSFFQEETNTSDLWNDDAGA